MKKCFEIFRSNSVNVQIITFDELYDSLKQLLSLLKSARSDADSSNPKASKKSNKPRKKKRLANLCQMLHRLPLTAPLLNQRMFADGIAGKTTKELLPVWRGKIVGSGSFCIVRSILIVGWHFDYPIKRFTKLRIWLAALK